jgi:hypothetical protein
MDDRLGVAVVTTCEGQHYGCGLRPFFSTAKHPLSSFTKRFITTCAQIIPSGREFLTNF